MKIRGLRRLQRGWDGCYTDFEGVTDLEIIDGHCFI